MEEHEAYLQTLEELSRRYPESSVLLVGCRPWDYSAGSLSRAVEDCDCQLLYLECFRRDGDWRVALVAGRQSAEAVAASLERYGFEVLEARAPSDFDGDSAGAQKDEQLRLRALEVLKYI